MEKKLIDVNDLDRYAVTIGRHRYIPCISLAKVSAAQQAPAKLDRNRLAGCEYCKGDLEGYTSVIKDWKGPGRMYIPDGEANLVVSGTYGHRACIQIRFCPFCGSPLTDEAWAELERRIGGL